MRETNEQITITMNFPYDTPDANGVVYSKEAVKRAIDKGFSALASQTNRAPIIGLIDTILLRESISVRLSIKRSPVTRIRGLRAFSFPCS
jgi:hypothetical protein